ncbi:MAG: hypothetical protein MHM6MM_000897 [Cercozoa sp. M6MM]
MLDIPLRLGTRLSRQGHPSKRHKELFRAEPILWPSKKAQQRQATVFVGIPSFRDSLCFRTVQSLFRKAKHPHRLRVGIYDQVDPHEGDVPCSHFVDVCNDENEKDRGAECDHIANVVIEEVGSSMATGVPTARYQMEKLLDNDSEFFVQVDAHTIFDPEWDTRMIAQWQNTENEFAVLTHYPNVADYSDDDYKRANSLSVLCGAKTKGAMNGFTKWSGQVWNKRTLKSPKDVPILMPFWGGGLSFSKAHRVRNVPYDPRLLFVFDADELTLSARLFTTGYDCYAPTENLVYHYYASAVKRPHVWDEGWDIKSKTNKKSAERVHALFGMPVDSMKHPDTSEVAVGELYGLGQARTLQDFWQFARMDITKNPPETTDFCADMAANPLKLAPYQRDPAEVNHIY